MNVMSTEEKRQYVNDAVELLKALIAIPRISRNEAIASNLIEEWMTNWGLNPKREANNLWAVADNYNEAKPTLLLNAHIDTVSQTHPIAQRPY